MGVRLMSSSILYRCRKFEFGGEWLPSLPLAKLGKQDVLAVVLLQNTIIQSEQKFKLEYYVVDRSTRSRLSDP